MSCDIRKYRSLNMGDSYSSEMILTAFVGGEKGGCIQFTIDGHYCALSEAALIDMVETITSRINHREGYTATGHEREDLLYKE